MNTRNTLRHELAFTCCMAYWAISREDIHRAQCLHICPIILFHSEREGKAPSLTRNDRKERSFSSLNLLNWRSYKEGTLTITLQHSGAHEDLAVSPSSLWDVFKWVRISTEYPKVPETMSVRNLTGSIHGSDFLLFFQWFSNRAFTTGSLLAYQT